MMSSMWLLLRHALPTTTLIQTKPTLSLVMTTVLPAGRQHACQTPHEWLKKRKSSNFQASKVLKL